MFDANAPKKIVRNVRIAEHIGGVADDERPIGVDERVFAVLESDVLLRGGHWAWFLSRRCGACNAGGVTTVDRELLAEAVRTAYLPALLVALAQALGDLSLLRDDLRPDPAGCRSRAPG